MSRSSGEDGPGRGETSRGIRELERRHRNCSLKIGAGDDATPTGPGDGGGDAEAAIEVLVRENRTFPPSEDFVAQALIKDRSVYVEAERDYVGFWLERAKEFVEWFKEPTESLQWDPPHCTWFADGELKVSYNSLLTVTFFLLGIGDAGAHENITKAGGFFGLATAAAAWYASFAGVTNSTFGRTVLPVKPLNE